MNINQTLIKAGLSEKETKIYITLLKNGKMKPSVLANLTKISRPLVYNISKGLVSKGLIFEDITGKVTYLSALSPDNLNNLIDDRKRELDDQEKVIKKAVADLSLITAGKEYPVPKIRLVEERDIEKFMHDNLIKWQDSIINTDFIWWGFQDHTFAEKYEKWIDSAWETDQSKNPNYKLQIFSNESQVEQKFKNKKYSNKRTIRFMDGSNFTGTTWVCGDYLIMITSQEHPFYLLEIHDKLLARNTAEIFKRLWNNEK